MYSNSRNDVPRVAQWYGTIAAYTRCCASVLVVFVVFCMHMHSFAGLIRRTPPPTFSDTAITNRHSDTTIFQLRAHWVRISWSIGLENRSDKCALAGVEPSTSKAHRNLLYVHPRLTARYTCTYATSSLCVSEHAIYHYVLKYWDT